VALTDLSRCSTAARHRGDPLPGSAPTALRWLLVEHPGPWAAQPLETAPLAGQIGTEVERIAATSRAKVLLVRRPGSRPSTSGAHTWAAVDTARGTWVRGSWRTASDVVNAAHALGGDLAASETPCPRIVLVCTHGTRDACCAVRGRPIVAALAREWPEEVWECTHLGGHRFAGTLLSLPDGVCFGRLDTDTAPRVLAAHAEGRTPAQFLRGVTRHEPVAQAAVAAVLAAHGPASATDATPRVVSQDGEHHVVEVLGDGALPDRCLVDVTVEQLSDAPLSCAAEPKAHHTFHTAVRVVPD
jgi:hypothetical protein